MEPQAFPRGHFEILKGKGVEVEEASLAELTLFNGDLDDGTFPAPVAALRDAMHGADGLLIACPEYNHSIPAVMKNAIEWTCRPPNCWTGKVVFGMGTTPGRSGGIRMHLHLSDCLQCEGAWLIPRPMVLVPNAASVFGDDGVTAGSGGGRPTGRGDGRAGGYHQYHERRKGVARFGQNWL